MEEPTLIEKQFMFSRRLAELIEEACIRGYSVTMGETYRPPETADLYAKRGIGIKNSLHCLRLAVDIQIFRDGKWLKKTEDYEGLALFWESLSTTGFQCTWGGRFKSLVDPSHFSIAHNGVK